jgi:hypothetical protein
MCGEGGGFLAVKAMLLVILYMGCLVSLRKAGRGIACFYVWYVQLSCLLWQLAQLGVCLSHLGFISSRSQFLK